MWLLCPPLFAGEPSYTLSFDAREQHLVHVRATIPAAGPETTLFMPTWTPGSYLVREYARNVERLGASGADGAALPVRKVTKNRWVVESSASFTLDYDVYAHELSVRTNWVDDELAVLNGAATFVLPVGYAGPIEVTLDLPDAWSGAVSPLRGEDVLTAADVDTLIDSPIVVGNPNVEKYTVDGVPHFLVDIPTRPGWDSAKAARGARKVAEALQRFWGDLPYERYVVLNWLTDGGGGLEHAESTLVMGNPGATSDEEAYARWLALLAHEQFHAWNGKRLRPVGLGPFDYENEVYTRDLWFVEGFTSYYDDLLLVRAGVLDERAYLERLGSSLAALASTPGREVQSLSEASHDAWIKHYRPDENTKNTSVSYYAKGALVAWLLDAHIRASTADARSLDDVMRALWKTHGTPYTSSSLRSGLSEAAGLPLEDLLHRWVDTTEELDLAPALAHFGLEQEVRTGAPRAWLGLEVTDGKVAMVRRDGPAYAAGVSVGDELVALDGQRIRDLPAALEGKEPGKRAALTVTRRGRLVELDVVLGGEPGPTGLSVRADSTRQQDRHRNRWLTGR
ncbi:MAG: M61 family metallopeptidase [Alphaproteobacteria bacterium]|nr:M61 family metallopeptidase [Alphaproteobacteria bacterium]